MTLNLKTSLRWNSLIIFWLFLFGIGHAQSAFEELWKYPDLPLAAKTVKSYSYRGIRVEEIYYSSSLYKNKPVRIFGYFCLPKKNYQLPAILLVHGGGGGANLKRASSWASKGYAVLAIDLPGKGDKRRSSRSGGPDMDVPILLRTLPDLSYNYLVHAVAATRAGITYLAQRKEIDPSHIGMVGLSWGGVITLITNGLDKRLKTAVNVFGAGYIYEGSTWQDRFAAMSQEELEFWKTFIDPKNFLSTQHAPILFITGSNDHCYYLPTFQKSYAEVEVPKKIFLIPNLRHRFLPETQLVIFKWLNNHLKGSGSFPEVESFGFYQKDQNKIIAYVKAKALGSIKKAKLYWAGGTPSRWTEKKWKDINGYLEKGIYYFGIPASLLKPEIQFFASVEDTKGGATSTPVRSLFKAFLKNGEPVYLVSSPILEIHKHGLPLKVLGREIATFETVYYSKQERKYYLR